MTSRARHVVTLGECMGSFVARERGAMAESTEFLRTIAGAEANVAVGLARLGHTVSYVGRIGADGLGTAVVRRLRGEGVDVEHLRVDKAATTGVMIRELRDVGPAEVIYWRTGSAGARLSPEDVAAADGSFERAAWLHITGITPALSASAAAAASVALEMAKARGLTVSLDINFRRRLWTEPEARAMLAPLVDHCDVVLGGVDELAIIGGLADTLEGGREVDPVAAADAVLGLGANVVVARLGAAGAIEQRRDGGPARSLSAPALEVAHVLDPVGAGDAFTAGYIATILDGGSAAEALRAGNACGAAAVASLGDQTGLPTRLELDRLLATSDLDTLR